MKMFKDNAGRTWTVSVTVASIKRVRDLCGVDLLDIVQSGKSDDGLIARLATDPVLLCNVVYALCQPEAAAAGVSDEQFGEAMGGDALDGATTALLEDLVAFFPSARRQVLGKALAKLRAVEDRAAKLALDRLDSPEIEAELARILESSGGPASSLPPSPGPNQDPALCAN